MNNKRIKDNKGNDQYEVTLHNVNKAREKQLVLDPEKGPENKPRKNK